MTNTAKKINLIEDNKTELANRLKSVIALRKKVEKEEKELKSFFKGFLDTGEVFETNEVSIVISEKNRSSLDKKSIEEALGLDFVKKHTTSTKYTQVDVKSKL